MPFFFFLMTRVKQVLWHFSLLRCAPLTGIFFFFLMSLTIQREGRGRTEMKEGKRENSQFTFCMLPISTVSLVIMWHMCSRKIVILCKITPRKAQD